MSDASTTTVAQLLFSDTFTMDFARMVAELDAALAQCEAPTRSPIAICGDTVIFDIDGTRIMLGLAYRPDDDMDACLSASVGPAPGSSGEGQLLRRSAAICGMIAERIQARYPANAVLWHKIDGPMTPEDLEALLQQLPLLAQMEPVMALASDLPPPQPPVAANDFPDLPLPRGTSEAMRAALYPEGPPWLANAKVANVNAMPMRLAIHTMNTTLILVSLPVGAAMLTYSVLRGEDLKVTARVMALTGATIAFMQSQIGQTLLALI